MLVSIIIPIYNAEKYIKRCLNSIADQEVITEIICVDDGSTDNSRQIIEAFAEKNKNVIYIYQENSGASAARNNGLKHANGELCMFFDADDILYPDALKKMTVPIINGDAELVIGNYDEIDDNEKIIGTVPNGRFIHDCPAQWKYAVCPPLPGNKLFLKRVLDNSGLGFSCVKIGQDLNFYLKLLLLCPKTVCIDDTVMGYRIVDGSISRQYSLMILDICNSVDDVRSFYTERGHEREHDSYISVAELIAYRSQFAKIKKFDDINDIKKISSVFNARISKCKIPHRSLLITYIKERIKCLRLTVISCFLSFRPRKK